MNFSSWSIRNPIPVIVLFLVLTVLGIHSFNKMNIQNFPDIEFPIVNVDVTWHGASPEQLETEVVRKIEDALANINYLRHTYTTVVDGSVKIIVEFELEKSVNEAIEDVRNAVDSIYNDLPAAVQKPTISKLNISNQPIATYVVSSTSLDKVDLSWFIDNKINKALMQVSGVGQVSRVGGVDREVRVELNTTQMNGLGITASEVSQAITQMQQDAPGGVGRIAGQEQTIRILGNIATVDELRELKIPTSSMASIRLADIATVLDTTAEQKSRALLDGNEVIMFSINRSKDTSEVTVLHDARQMIEMLQEQYPTMTIKEINDSVKYVENQYKDSIWLLIEGAILAVLVVWWFLRNNRATIVAAVALPLSIIPTFWVMDLIGFNINTISLISFSLVIGVLVDDAIVEVENIIRHMQMGKTPLQAAIDGTNEIGLAVIATTMTLIAVFLPTAFMEGIIGKFFVQYGWTTSIAVFFSLLVARLLTPMMCAYLLKDKMILSTAHEHKDSRWMRSYLWLVRKCLTYRWTTITTAGGLFIASILLLGALPAGFMPSSDLSATIINVQLPPGSTLSQTQETAEKIRTTILADEPSIRDVYSVIGSDEVNHADIHVLLVEPKMRQESQQDIEKRLRDKVQAIAGARITVNSVDSGEAKFEFSLVGENTQLLEQTANQLEKEIRTISGLGAVTSSASLLRPQVIIRPDYARASIAGVTTENLANIIRIATNADYSQTLPKLSLPERLVPIAIRMMDFDREHLDTIADLRVSGHNGLVPLASVATVELSMGAISITRLDRKRNIDFSIELNDIPLGDLVNQIQQLSTMQHLPDGVEYQDSGNAQMMLELFTGFATAMIIGILAVYLILILLFHDFLQPITILSALPLATIGAFIALFLCQFAISMPALIGIIMLMGIVTKNSILLVDYILIAYKEGAGRLEAIIDACHKRSRPIVMTTIAMVAGMLPTALGFSSDPSFSAPMAVVVVGGLLTSTLLSLIVIPVVYSVIDDMKIKVKSIVY
ncbi:efflux RND transporter permease subunit [Zophobihabitans entericus]|uniref:Efflux RND transporter permease subunit n=1 Tax=Zophobihabitans entericus TaxID=1635327 RepID=A0A6G9I8L6_9GAMM|nr:efflux RND transporter permease subunit [Zophobihabitans entericus]QIQ20555.1 efflux RND transporter permease subunit [Zophobihabitans entericus]